MPPIRSVVVAERRRAARAQSRVSVGLQFGGQVVMAQTKDFSACGMFVETDVKLEVGTDIDIFLMPPGAAQSLRLPGAVARAGATGVGIDFAPMPPEVRAGFDAFLQTLSPDEDQGPGVQTDAFDPPLPAPPPVSEPQTIPDEFNPVALRAALEREQKERAEKLAKAQELHEAAKEALVEGRWTRMAIVLLERAVELSPGVAAFHHDLGAAYYEVGDVDRAAKEFDKALQLEPWGRD